MGYAIPTEVEDEDLEDGDDDGGPDDEEEGEEEEEEEEVIHMYSDEGEIEEQSLSILDQTNF